MKRKFEASIKGKGLAAKAREKEEPDRIVINSNYTDRSICGLMWINRDNVDYMIVTFRSLHKVKGSKLVNAENYYENRMLQESRQDFPGARMIAFYSRGNWHLQIRDLIREVLSSHRIKLNGLTGNRKCVYRLQPDTTKRVVLKALNKALRSGRCKDYIRLKEIDLKSLDVLKEKIDNINKSKYKIKDVINKTKEQANMDGSKLSKPTARKRRRTKVQIMMDEAAADTKQRRIEQFFRCFGRSKRKDW